MFIQALPPAQGERRLLLRHNCDVALPQWMALVGERLQSAQVRDISSKGIGLLLDYEVDPRQRLRIELPSLTGALWHLKVLDVIHATPREGTHWIVGGVFPAPLTDEQLRILLT
jgi:hypothetical protein